MLPLRPQPGFPKATQMLRNPFPQLLAAIILLTSGCDTSAPEVPRQPDPVHQDVGASTPRSEVDAPAPGVAVWDVIYMQQQPVGYQSLLLAPRGQGDAVVFDATASSALRVQRFGEVTHETLQMSSRENRDGEVVWIESRIQSGGGEIHTTGRRQGSELQCETRSGDGAHQWSVPLPSHCGGFFAVEWSLHRSPLVPGEHRELSAIVPVLNQVASIALTAGDYEPVALLEETIDLLPVRQRLVLPGGVTMDSISWVNATGDILKAEIATLQQTSYRVNRETALGAFQQASFDLGQFSSVRLPRPLAAPQLTRQVRYQIRMREDNPAEFFRHTPGQSVTVVDPHTIILTVRALSPHDGSAPPLSETPPGPAERQPSAMIQSDATVVRELVEEIKPPTRDPWSLAVATERFVFNSLTQKDFSTAFATAADVARSRQGDCTEHAVLTAALCRAQQVPCRVLVGLVYVGAQQGFAFHMWNEAWIEDRWIPIDATMGRGRVAATHLILGRSGLETGDTFTSLLPVMKVMGKLEIEVLDAQYDTGPIP